MTRIVRLARVSLLTLVGLLPAERVLGQQPVEFADERALVGNKFSPYPPAPSALPVSDPPPPTPAAARVPAVGPYGVSAHSADRLLEPYRLERPGAAPGWYAGFDLALVKPHVTNRVTSGTPIDAALPDPVQLPVAPLTWTVSPRFELGYRLPSGRGDLRLGYRFLATSGTERDGAGGVLKSRLDFNAFDFDYVSGEWLAENAAGPFRDLRLALGVRLATSYLDSAASGGASGARFSSHFVGAGPHFGAEWSHALPSYPLELYTRFDAAGVIGGTRQNFAASATDATGAQFGAARRGPSLSNAVSVVGAECGLAWRPERLGRSRVVVGYRYEQWWNLGRTDDSNFDLSVQGSFLQVEWRY